MNSNLCTVSWARYRNCLASTLALFTFAALSGCGHSSHGSAATSVTASPSLLVTSMGSVNAVINGGAVAATMVFNSSETAPVTGLSVTSGLSSLPAGWSGPTTFGCASVPPCSGCVLNLTYAPTAIAKGSLVIEYAYKDSAGKAQNGSASIDYAGTTNNNILATPNPTGQIVAAVGGSQALVLTFNTDDGNSATALNLTTELTSLPAGWTSTAHSLSCATVSTGNACQLPLSFAPTSVGTGTLTLSYDYVDNFGSAKTGTVHIPYAGTTHDNVVGTAAPSPVYSAVGAAALAVPVTFTTDDGNPATNLVVTSSLTALPAGWSSTATNFSCGTVSGGTSCQLPLTFTAAIGATGTLQLAYSYVDNAGSAKTGSVNIVYTSATHDNVVGTPSVAGTVRVAVGGSQVVSVTLNTDDGNIASNLTVTSGLASLPTYWSGPANFSCASVSTGTGCRLNLTFAPQASVGGTVTLGYSYTDSAGTAKTGTVSMPYAVKHIYVTDSNGVYVCSIVTGGDLAGCALTALDRHDSGGAGWSSGYGITFSGDYAFVNQYPDGSASSCALDRSDGTLADCVTFNYPGSSGYGYSVFATDSYLYIGNGNSGTYCAIGANGALTNCNAVTNGVTEYSAGIFVGPNLAYVTPNGGNVQACAVAANGDLGPCTDTGIAGDSGAITVSGKFAFLASWSAQAVRSCPIGNDGSLAACISSPVPGVGQGFSVSTAVYVENAYTVTGSDVQHCVVNATTGALSACAPSNGGASFSGPSGVGIY